jgi:hypothetical protein
VDTRMFLRGVIPGSGTTNREHHDGYIMVGDAQDLHHLVKVFCYNGKLIYTRPLAALTIHARMVELI